MIESVLLVSKIMFFLLELLEIVLGREIYKKIEKWVKERKKRKKEALKKSQKEKNIVPGQISASCTGCNQILKEPPVYEQGKPWCQKCYKTQVLKLR